jgi:3-oxoacyl-[acyl-carrier protein] reductase
VSVAIVTGAAGAIGQAIARRLLEDDTPVLCVDRAAAVEDVCSELGDGATPCVVDLAAADAGDRVLAAAGDVGSGEPAVLVNNAGITRDGRALAISPEDFALVVRVNLVAPLRLAYAVGPRLADGGSVINISSRAAFGNFGQANYVAAKSGLIGATRALALEWAPRVRVNAVAPGLVETPMTRAMPPAVYEKLVALVPAGRAGQPHEVAEVVAFLASRRASHVTGQVVTVCGGRSVGDQGGEGR